jgi:hypothetical protein
MPTPALFLRREANPGRNRVLNGKMDGATLATDKEVLLGINGRRHHEVADGVKVKGRRDRDKDMVDRKGSMSSHHETKVGKDR